MKKLIMHVGHGKTGSSFLQSALVLSRASLAQAGYVYPPHPNDARAAKGHISTGNLFVSGKWQDYILKSLNEIDGDIIYSSEFLAANIAKNEEFFLKLHGLAQLKLVLFVRDPLSYEMSAYDQMVKRGGCVKSFEEFLEHGFFMALSTNVLNAIKFCRAEGIDLVIRNYSNYSGDTLLSAFAEAAGLPAGCLQAPPVAIVNRSLTHAERHLQRSFNRVLGKASGRIIADPLCNELPGVKSEKPFLSRQAYNDYMARVAQRMEAINAHLPAGEQYRVEPYPELEDRGDMLQFSENQIDVVVKNILSHYANAFEAKHARDAMLSKYVLRMRVAGVDVGEIAAKLGLKWLERPLAQLSARRLRRLGFDVAWYRARYPDVASSNIDPTLHFVRYGFAEGRHIRLGT